MSIFKKIYVLLFVWSMVLFLCAPSAFAQAAAPIQPKETILKAQVIQILKEGEVTVENYKNPYQTVKIKLLDGANKNKEIVIDYGKTSSIREEQKVSVGQTIVVAEDVSGQKTEYQIIDTYRLNTILYIAIFFFFLVITLSRWKGIGSIIGLCISLTVIVWYMLPQILAGEDPLTVSIVSAILILTTSIYFAHGFSKKTTVAIVATCIALSLSGLLAVLFVYLTKLTGLGSDDAYMLNFGMGNAINARGLLLGGIIIGSLGVLDDITTGTAATVFELAKANPNLTFKQLSTSALRIGSEHISSLVNTLVLAYAGASLPLFLFIVLNPQKQPLWVIMNNELIAEEIVRTLAGSIGLVLAVPLTTLLAAWVVKRLS